MSNPFLFDFFFFFLFSLWAHPLDERGRSRPAPPLNRRSTVAKSFRDFDLYAQCQQHSAAV
jgi:hypothetical protein